MCKSTKSYGNIPTVSSTASDVIVSSEGVSARAFTGGLVETLDKYTV